MHLVKRTTAVHIYATPVYIDHPDLYSPTSRDDVAFTLSAESPLHSGSSATSLSIITVSARRSSGRNHERPPDSSTKGSGLARFVHAVGMERTRPLGSSKIRRSPPQFRQCDRRGNRLPCRGWKGWVTSNSPGGSGPPGAVDIEDQRHGRIVLREPGVRAPGPPGVPEPRRSANGGIPVHRGVVQPETSILRPGLSISRSVRG